MPWPIDGPLILEESLTRGTDGYAGLFDPAAPRIEVSYAASDAIILHELVHAWFNGGLVADRWVAEAFASYYADVVGVRLGLGATPLAAGRSGGRRRHSPQRLGRGRGPGDGGVRLRRVARARARNRRPDRRGPPPPVVVARRGEHRRTAGPGRRPLGDPGGAEQAAGPRTGATCSTCSRSRPTSRSTTCGERGSRGRGPAALDARGPAREAYGRTLQAALPWRLPPSIRGPAPQFDVADELLVQADAVLVQRACSRHPRSPPR